MLVCARSKDNMTVLILTHALSTANMTTLVCHTPTDLMKAPTTLYLQTDWTRPDWTRLKLLSGLTAKAVKLNLHKQNATSQQ